MGGSIGSRRWARRILLALGASIIAGCGGSVRSTGSGGTGPIGGGAGTGMGGAGQGGYGGEECRAIQVEAQLMAERSCEQASDCVRPSHMMGDCTDCGVVTNTRSSESALDAARSVCERFYENGCEAPLHPCPAYRPSCVNAVCAPY